MSGFDLGTKIRSVFYLVFALVFSFVFILISYHIELNQNLISKNGDLTLDFLVENLEAQERYLYEDFSIGNFNSISFRLRNFLETKSIKNFSLIAFDQTGCVLGSDVDCKRFSEYVINTEDKGISVTKAMDSIFLRVPINLWDSSSNYIGIEIKSAEIFPRQSFFEIIVFRILPFFVVVLLVLYFYVLAEKKVINPAIAKILQAESLKVQKNILRQFSHDIRSPLAVVNDMFNLDYENDKEISSLLKSSLQRVVEMSNDFLAEKCSVDVSTDVVQILKDIIGEKLIEYRHLKPLIKLNSNVENIFLKINKVEFARSLSNLLNNSIEASSKKVPEIEIYLCKENSFFSLVVSDNGEGIPKENLPLILDGEFSTKKDGHGLGVKGVIRWLSQINGKFEIESDFGKGTTVKILIPEYI
jgi:signal transduction histidine kinase